MLNIYIYTNYKDFHYGMDDHAPYTCFEPSTYRALLWNTSIYIIIYIHNDIYIIYIYI